MTAKIHPIKRDAPAAPRAELVEEQVRAAIHKGLYKPGERIRESQVAEWLGVSRTPVREALRRLESEGLLSFKSWRGVVVAELDRQQVIELYAMRAILEGAAAGLAARHIGEAELHVLERLLSRADGFLAQPDRLAEVNRTFHQAIHSAAHNRYLMETLNGLRNSLALLQGTTFSIAGRAESAQDEHRAILAAIKARDSDAAELAARRHIQAAERTRLAMLFAMDG
ncbi:MAG: GntR family transcriptional regulator [Pseudomonadota bacterium]